MIVDSSALISILQSEDDEAFFSQQLGGDGSKKIAAGSAIEVHTVIARRHRAVGLKDLSDLIATAEIKIAPTDYEQVKIANAAFLKFGKGMGNSAQLNFGDLFTYALAKQTGLPVLCKGEDFIQTDVDVIRPS